MASRLENGVQTDACVRARFAQTGLRLCKPTIGKHRRNAEIVDESPGTVHELFAARGGRQRPGPGPHRSIVTYPAPGPTGASRGRGPAWDELPKRSTSGHRHAEAQHIEHRRRGASHSKRKTAPPRDWGKVVLTMRD